jgi:putative heme iron utilization protein
LSYLYGVLYAEGGIIEVIGFLPFGFNTTVYFELRRITTITGTGLIRQLSTISVWLKYEGLTDSSFKDRGMT